MKTWLGEIEASGSLLGSRALCSTNSHLHRLYAPAILQLNRCRLFVQGTLLLNRVRSKNESYQLKLGSLYYPFRPVVLLDKRHPLSAGFSLGHIGGHISTHHASLSRSFSFGGYEVTNLDRSGIKQRRCFYLTQKATIAIYTQPST